MAFSTYWAADSLIIGTSERPSRILAGTPSARAPGGTTMLFGTTALAPTVAPAADDGVVQHDAARARQRLVLEGAALEVREVPDDAAVADDGGEARPGVDHRPVLNRRRGADGDRAVVAAQDGVRPHARLGADRDVADDDGVGVDVGLGVDPRRDPVELVDRHGEDATRAPATQVTP